ncbi:MAG TPA: cobaltochelatase subunit CobN, partial [Candidatus Dormibacteraeota bacterium]|nr:cobaltochelatase subunit CobN [Candidatus Dormibacteraeota bacterium]
MLGLSCTGWTAEEVRTRLEPLLPRSGCVALRLLGGRRAIPEAVDAIAAACATHGVALVAWPGDLTPDAELSALTTLDAEVAGSGFAYLVHGGEANVAQLVRLLSDATCRTRVGCEPPRPVPWDGRHHPRAPEDAGAAEDWWRAHLDPADERPVVGLVFYRAHWMTGNLAVVDALCTALEETGCRALPVFCYSLRTEADEPPAFAHLRDAAGRPLCDALISTLSFAMGELPVTGPQVAAEWSVAALERLGVPVVQAIAATGSRERWERSDAGLTPVDVVMNVALPEFDGRIVSVPVSFKESVDGVTRYVPDLERVRRCAGLAARLARLRRLPRAEARLAVVLSSYPTRNARVGNAVGLDTPASAVRLLAALRDDGYDLGEGALPDDGDALMHRLLAGGGYDREYLTAEQLAAAPGHLSAAEYRGWFDTVPVAAREQMRRSWGEPPGRLYADGAGLAFAGLRFGNVLVCIQPPRGFGEDPAAIYHSPDLAPSHHYLGFHRWLRDGFGAAAVVHLGKHGTMEWLPGKALGLSAACFPDLCIADLPLFYPFVVNDPGEGTQAKRRAHAVVVDHLIPPVSTADAYGPIVAVEQLMDEYYQAQALDPDRLPLIQERIWEEVRRAHLDADLAQAAAPDDFDAFLLRMDGYLCEIKDGEIRNGLHVLGAAPDGEALLDMLRACAGATDGGIPGLDESLARACGLDWDELLADRGAAIQQGKAARPRRPPASAGAGGVGHGIAPPAPSVHPSGPSAMSLARAGGRYSPPVKTAPESGVPVPESGVPLPESGTPIPPELMPYLSGAPRVAGDLVEAVHAMARDLIAQLAAADFDATVIPGLLDATVPSNGAAEALEHVATILWPALRRTTDEIGNLLLGLRGGYVPAGPSGAPTRGMTHVLPTGRNFYSVDPKSLPTETSWRVGSRLAEA